MKNSIVKFIYDTKKGNDKYNNHWKYCCENKIPFIRVIKSGTKYWQIEYDVASITLMSRFIILNYAEHIIPLYKLYSTYSNLPTSKYSAIGGGRNLIFTVYKKDTPDIANKLFDLIVLLAERDQELFDENPYIVNKEGFNSEGVHVIGYAESLKTLSDEQLLYQYKIHKHSNPHRHQTHDLYKMEIERRKLTETY